VTATLDEKQAATTDKNLFNYSPHLTPKSTFKNASLAEKRKMEEKHF